MADHSTRVVRSDLLVTAMVQQMATLTRRLGDWVAHETPTLETIEHHLLPAVKELASSLLAGLCHLTVPGEPSATIPCACGAAARYQRRRPATVKTVVGRITVTRPYYLCPVCHQGSAPLDQQLELCAGGLSAGLAALGALLGATQSSFAAAADVLETLTLVSLSPTAIREVTEGLGEVILVHEAQTLVMQETAVVPPPVRTRPTRRMYVSMDGRLVHLHGNGWTECKLGTVYTTTTRVSRRDPAQVEIRGVDHSYVADLTSAATFGRRVWAEAARRGVLEADEVVVLGDGAHWIWNVATEYFPEAVHIVDWYHASSYMWGAAHAIYGEGSTATAWAETHLEQLWAGRVTAVIAQLHAHQALGGAVTEAITYDTNHQGRMNYPHDRARGLQVGSGSIESGCKQVLAARLKQAGMLWSHDGALAVAAVRTWLKSGRWQEAVRLRPPQRRRRCPARTTTKAPPIQARAGAFVRQGARTPQGTSPERPLHRRRETTMGNETRPATNHPWRRAWSIRRQRQEAAGQHPPPATTPSS